MFVKVIIIDVAGKWPIIRVWHYGGIGPSVDGGEAIKKSK